MFDVKKFTKMTTKMPCEKQGNADRPSKAIGWLQHCTRLKQSIVY